MSKQKPALTITLVFGGRRPRTYTIKLFAAADWPVGFFPGIRKHSGRYRVRVGRRWYSADGVQPTCLTYRQFERKLWNEMETKTWLAQFDHRQVPGKGVKKRRKRRKT